MALKVVSKSIFLEKCNIKNLKEERKILMKARNPFVTNLYGTFQDDCNVYCKILKVKKVVLEFIPAGDVHTLLKEKQKLSEKETKFIVSEIIIALEFLHKQNIVYRDLKIKVKQKIKKKNILIDGKGHMKLCDFGFSKFLDTKTFSVCGTPYYVSPEILQKTGHNTVTDYWSLGVLTYELLVGRPPFYKKKRKDLFNEILNSELEFPENIQISSSMKDFISKLLIKGKFMTHKKIQKKGLEAKESNRLNHTQYLMM
jgi:serine/threonine protein kinase